MSLRDDLIIGRELVRLAADGLNDASEQLYLLYEVLKRHIKGDLPDIPPKDPDPQPDPVPDPPSDPQPDPVPDPPSDPAPTPGDKIPDVDEWSFLHADSSVMDWPETSKLKLVMDTKRKLIFFNHSKVGVWPAKYIRGVSKSKKDLMYANPWAVFEYRGVWYAATFEWMRQNQIAKPFTSLHGDHIKQDPIPMNWRPKLDQTILFFVSGLARGGQRTVEERSNLWMIKWPFDNSDYIFPTMIPDTVKRESWIQIQNLERYLDKHGHDFIKAGEPHIKEVREKWYNMKERYGNRTFPLDRMKYDLFT